MCNRFKTEVCWETCIQSSYITTSDAHYKEKVFQYGQFLYATFKYSFHCISYTPNKPKNIIHIKFALGFGDELPEYNITDEELEDGPNSPLIHVSVYVLLFLL